jgi:tRNA(Glu) U13 pseudouridine synthase TruD
MSNLLKEAIVDAKALRDSALKNAEATIIEKYSKEVKDTMDQLLEQDEGLMGEEAGPDEVVAKNVPLAATDDLSEEEGEMPNNMNEEGEEVPVTIDLQALQEAIAELNSEMNEEDVSEYQLPPKDEKPKDPEEDEQDLDEEIEITEEDLAAMFESDEEVIEEEDDVESENPVEADADAMDKAGLEEDFDTDDLVAAIMEKLTVDMGADLAGWAGRSADDQKFQMEKELARRRSTDVAEELETLKKAQEELVFENKQLTEKLSNYEEAVEQLRESLQDVNLSNGRLLYTNRVLRNPSLNERQKEKIVEAISNAGSVTEAKVIYETLQSTVEAKPKRSPKTLSEAISSKRASVIRATRQESAPSDPMQERMKRLAGIK